LKLYYKDFKEDPSWRKRHEKDVSPDFLLVKGNQKIGVEVTNILEVGDEYSEINFSRRKYSSKLQNEIKKEITVEDQINYEIILSTFKG